jgi:2-succinyl-6-hydroxy-2,4-cyclohexadiene-1-carboxylate synthase
MALVVLHGFTGNRSSFAHLKPAWERQCTVLAVDIPGHGESSFEDGLDYPKTIAVLLALLDEEGIKRANLLGYSLGARLALGLALRQPSRWERLILESGSPGLRRRKARSERRRDDEAWAQAIEARGVEEFVKRWEALPLFEGLRRLEPEVGEALRARRSGHTPEGLAGSLRALGLGAQPNFWPELHRLMVPTLLLTGARDAKFTNTAIQMAAELPLVWRRALAGVGHAPHLEAPAEYAAEVLSFLGTPWMETTPWVERETGAIDANA